MSSQKEEPNASILFGDSAGDDPFSQLQQQNPVSEVKQENKRATAKEQTQPVPQNNNVVSDASGLFGGSSNSNADLFFSSAVPTQQQQQPQQQQQQQTHQPTNANASAASFFDQPTQSDSFFDGLGQGNQAASSLTQAYDPNAYASYDYNTQSTGQQQVVDNQQVQEYDQSQWIQFDPNTHYYYDEQGQVHYYDPNTNQEYDVSQYGYDQQGQTYDYQYDPQYAEYYAQQGYDPNAYSTEQQADQQQQQYDHSAYEQQQQAADGSYYDYSNQGYTPVTDAVAEVPAQIQSEQTIGTQHYTPQEDYGAQQNYTPADASTEPQQQQQQEFNYGGYDSTDLQQYSTDNAYALESTAQPGTTVDNNFVQNNNYDPVSQDFSQVQNEFIAEDLQQAPPPPKNFPPPPAATAAVSVPPPPMNNSAPPRSELSPPPMNAPSGLAPPKALSPSPSEQPKAATLIPPPPKDVDILSTQATGPQSRKNSLDANVPAQKEVEEEVNLDDLDDLVLGGSESKSSQQLAADEFDHIMSTADYDGQNKQEPVYTNPNAYEEEEKHSEQTVPAQNDSVAEPSKTEEKPVDNLVSHQAEEQKADEPKLPEEPVSETIQQTEPTEAYASSEPNQTEQVLDHSSHVPTEHTSNEPEQGEQNVDFNAYAPQQVDYSPYAPQQDEQAVDYNAYAPQDEQIADYSSYAPQGEQTVDYSSYNSQQDEQTIDYNAYAPQGEQTMDYSSYAPQQGEQTVDYNSYEPQQSERSINYGSYEPQQGEQAVDYSSYAPQKSEQAFDYSSYAPQEQKAYATLNQAQGPQVGKINEIKSREVVSNYAPLEQSLPKPSAPLQQAVDYSPYTPQKEVETKLSAPPQPSNDYSSYAPQQDVPPQQTAGYSAYAPPPRKLSTHDKSANVNAPPSRRSSNNEQISIFNAPPSRRASNNEQPAISNAPSLSAPPKQQAIASPPLRSTVVSPPPTAMYGYPQRSNSITEPDRRQSPVSFGYYNNQVPIERSATVPPPITGRIASPRPQLVPCPDPNCEGENKVKAKFCCECGRPLAGISRSTTPSVTMSPGYGNDTFSPISTTFAPVTERSVVDEKKDAMISSLKTFMAASPLINADQQLALNYIDSRISEFDENKALLWKIVREMIQHQESALGDGGELDKSIIALLSACTDESSTGLDQLEYLLLNGDREIATQYAIDNDMWSHALIISQSNNAEHFKRVISQFIDRELFTSTTELRPQLPSDKKSLRMLYSIFGGAGADAVLELARYSPQDHPIHCTADQLQSEWKKSLSLVLANRSSKDTDAINGLGNQLQQSGLIHSAYICFILSSSLESQHIVGAQDTDIYTDLDALYLTELYEYASKSKLDTYKFIQAWWLMEFGFTNESKIYTDAIVSSNELDKLGDICNTATSENVTSLLNRSTFDTLIGAISNNQDSYDNTGDNTYNYGYGYGGGYTAPADQDGLQTKGIQSPFQVSASVPQTSPFQAASPMGAVRSPFGGYAAPATNDSSSGGWWGSEEQTSNGPEDLQQKPAQQQIETSYQPDAYTPAAATTTSNTAYDDDDDLGFGNTKKKPAKAETETKEAEAPREEKPNEITSEDKKEQEKGGWGIFSLFGRKEKDPNSDEKKAVKANLGEQSSFYYDEKEKRWVNKLNDSKPVAATPPPPPKAATPKPSPLAGPPQAPPSITNTPPMGGPPVGGLKPASAPPIRTSSTPNVLGSLGGGPPSVAPPSFNTPPATRRAGGARKPMRSRYVDVLNTPPS